MKQFSNWQWAGHNYQAGIIPENHSAASRLRYRPGGLPSSNFVYSMLNRTWLAKSWGNNDVIINLYGFIYAWSKSRSETALQDTVSLAAVVVAEKHPWETESHPDLLNLKPSWCLVTLSCWRMELQLLKVLVPTNNLAPFFVLSSFFGLGQTFAWWYQIKTRNHAVTTKRKLTCVKVCTLDTYLRARPLSNTTLVW